jgi:hypothetical protein
VAKRASMSDQITREVLENYLFALGELGLGEPMAGEARASLPRIPPPEVAPSGRLMEWDAEYEECEPRHRHVSHLYGLYPGDRIPPRGRWPTPAGEHFWPEATTAPAGAWAGRSACGRGWGKEIAPWRCSTAS